jgi:protein TonB
LTYAAAFSAAVTLHGVLALGLGGALRSSGDRVPEIQRHAEDEALAVTFRRPEPVQLEPQPNPPVTRLRESLPPSKVPLEAPSAEANIEVPEPVPEPESPAPVTPEPAVTEVDQPALPEAATTAGSPASADSSLPEDRTKGKSAAQRRVGYRRPASPSLRVKKPRPLKAIDVQALYPLGARLRGEEGVVRLTIRIGADGKLEGVEISESSGFAALDEAAERAIRRTRFAPATRNDEPIADDLTIAVRFRLDS